MSSLSITKRTVDGVVVLDLKGSIHIGEGNIDLHRTLRSLIEQNERAVLLNLAEVKSIDSSGLGELVAGYSTLEKNGGELKLLTVFDVYDNEATAIASFQTERPRITQRLDGQPSTAVA